MCENQLAKENTEIYRKLILWSCDNENNVSSTYSNFLTTLAGFFLAFSTFVIGNISFLGKSIKILFIVGITLIFLSLILGGIYIILKRKFFSDWTNNYSDLFMKWNTCETEDDKRKIEHCEECIYKKTKTMSSQWPLIIQTVALFLGILLLMLAVIFVFINS